MRYTIEADPGLESNVVLGHVYSMSEAIKECNAWSRKLKGKHERIAAIVYDDETGEACDMYFAGR
jgi:hypothetical protein